MSKRGILAFGGYIPKRRLARKTIAQAMGWFSPALKAQGRGERAIGAWDEDALTMAVEAARNVRRTEHPDLDTVWLASTTLPYADRDNAAILVEALGINPKLDTLDLSASQRAGTAALASALKAGDSTSLVVASDCRAAKPASPLEMKLGHGAAALTVGSSDAAPVNFLGHRAVSQDMVDHFRARGERFDYSVEDRWVRDEGFFKVIPETVDALLKETRVKGGDIQHVIFPCPARVAQRLGKVLGLTEGALVDDLAASCGFTGTPHPLLMLVRTLESAQPGEKILLVGFGQGADALLFETSKHLGEYQARRSIDAQLEDGVDEPSYVRYLAQQNLIPIDWGNRAEFDNRTALTAFHRNRDSVTSFNGGQCEDCDTVQFPRSRICVNPECRKVDTQVSIPLADVRGRIKSFTEDWLASSVNPPLQYGNVELEGGGNIFMEFTDCSPGSLAVGQTMEMCFRIKDVDGRRGFTRYFWKPTPVEE